MQWNHFVLTYKMGQSKRGHACWVEFPGDEQSLPLSDSLVDAGNEGWELVSTEYLPDGPSGQEIMCFFKKPR